MGEVGQKLWRQRNRAANRNRGRKRQMERNGKQDKESQRERTDPEKEKGMDGYLVGEAETGPFAHSHRHGGGDRGRETGGW